MPAHRRELLSSRLTFWLQIVPMLLWLADVYVLIWLVLHRFGGPNGLGGAGLMSTYARMVLLLLGVPFLLLPVVALWATGLRRVATDGSNLIVTLGTGFRAAIPLTAVREVSERRSMDLRAVAVTFEHRTRAGRRMRFLAPTRFVIPRGEPHPVVIQLRETVAAAKSASGIDPDDFYAVAAAPVAPPRPPAMARAPEPPAIVPSRPLPDDTEERPVFGRRKPRA